MKERTKARITVWGFWIFLIILLGVMSLNAFGQEIIDTATESLKDIKDRIDGKTDIEKKAIEFSKDDTLKEEKKTTDGYIFTTNKVKGKNGEQMRLFIYNACLYNSTQVLGDKTFKCDEKGFLKEI